MSKDALPDRICDESDEAILACDAPDEALEAAASPPRDGAAAMSFRADITSNTYWDWIMDHAFLGTPAQDYVGQFLATFRDYPQRQKAATFNLDDVFAKLKEGSGSK